MKIILNNLFIFLIHIFFPFFFLEYYKNQLIKIIYQIDFFQKKLFLYLKIKHYLNKKQYNLMILIYNIIL